MKGLKKPYYDNNNAYFRRMNQGKNSRGSHDTTEYLKFRFAIPYAGGEDDPERSAVIDKILERRRSGS